MGTIDLEQYRLKVENKSHVLTDFDASVAILPIGKVSIITGNNPVTGEFFNYHGDARRGIRTTGFNLHGQEIKREEISYKIPPPSRFTLFEKEECEFDPKTAKPATSVPPHYRATSPHAT